jgi:hypothetical protein
MKLKVSNAWLIPGIAVLSLASLPTLFTAARAQSSSAGTTAPNVNCKTSNLQASAPGVGVSAPNPSRLVPNVGKILRKGVGVPAPDTEAPDVGSPSASVSRTSVKCADANTNPSYSPSSGSSSTSSEAGVQGLW